jgi:ATP-dependent DNA ligase
MQTRKGNELLGFFPEIAAELVKLPDMVIDGERVVLDDEGKPEFHQLRGAVVRYAIQDDWRLRLQIPRPFLPSTC